MTVVVFTISARAVQRTLLAEGRLWAEGAEPSATPPCGRRSFCLGTANTLASQTPRAPVAPVTAAAGGESEES